MVPGGFQRSQMFFWVSCLGFVFLLNYQPRGFLWLEQTTRTRSPHMFGFSEIIPSERRLTSRPLMADGNKVCVHSEFARDTRALFSGMNTHMTSCFINLLTTNRSFRVFGVTHHLWSKLINLVWTKIVLFFHTGDIMESRWHWVCLQRYNCWFSELVKCSFAKGSI